MRVFGSAGLVVPVALAALLAGCTLEPLKSKSDLPRTDTAGEDTAAGTDPGPAPDNAAPDSAAPDTATPDTATPDTAAPDATTPDPAPDESPAEVADASAEAAGTDDSPADALSDLPSDVPPDVPPQPVCTGGACKVPAGPFQMGCTGDGCDDAQPIREVTVKEFWIDEREVTVADWKANCPGCGTPVVDGDSKCNLDQPGREGHPINCVEWFEAFQYCDTVGRRLCTEAEWEKAARGPDTTQYPWGDEFPDCSFAVWDGPGDAPGCDGAGTAAVGTVPAGASAYGPVDLIGNVKEWVADKYQAGYVGAPTDGSAWQPADATERVVRGAGWRTQVAADLKAGARDSAVPASRFPEVGIRCCQDAPAQ